jgi:DNA replication protein DnaC
MEGLAMMINEETRRKLHEMSLDEMVAALEIQSQQQSCLTLTFEERFQLLVDYAYQEKYTNKVKRLIKMARLRFPQATVDDIYYTERGLDRQAMLGIASCQFMKNLTNLIFHGFTGSGKSYLACAIGREACKQAYRTCYIRMPDLLQLHSEASITPSGPAKLLKKYAGYALLILDEWLIDDLMPQQEHFLFELIKRRYIEGSTVFCTQYRTEDWHARLGGGIHADAIIDRIIHNSIKVYAGDVNMREKQFKQ